MNVRVEVSYSDIIHINIDRLSNKVLGALTRELLYLAQMKKHKEVRLVVHKPKQSKDDANEVL